MTIDHIAFAFVPINMVLYYIMRLFGRLTAPIMSFFISEGFIHTRNRKKYLLRLIIFAVISQPFYFIMIFSRLPKNAFEFLTNLNVMFTLCLGLISLIIMSNKKILLPLKVIMTGVCFATADLCDWSFIIPAWIMIFYFLRNDKVKRNVAFISVSVVLLLLRFLPCYDSFLQFSYQFGVLLSLIPMTFYNEKKRSEVEKNNRLTGKWLFYIYYPLHMASIILILNIDKIMFR